MQGEPHPHEGGLAAGLESLYPEVVLGVAEPRVPALVGGARVLRDLVRHSPVEPRVVAGHARFEFHPPTTAQYMKTLNCMDGRSRTE